MKLMYEKCLQTIFNAFMEGGSFLNFERDLKVSPPFNRLNFSERALRKQRQAFSGVVPCNLLSLRSREPSGAFRLLLSKKKSPTTTLLTMTKEGEKKKKPLGGRCVSKETRRARTRV